MTKLLLKYKKCAVCGETSKHRFIAFNQSLGSHDLELRPPNTKNGIMHNWVNSCPNCGYAAGSLDDPAPSIVDREWLQRESYRETDNIVFRNHYAMLFYRQYLICLAGGNTIDAFYAVLHAAWCCDDASDAENAATCRNLALDLIDNIIQHMKDKGEKTAAEGYHMLRMNLLRRTGQFERLQQEYRSFSFSQWRLRKVKKFQLVAAANRDTKCYTMDDAK